MLGHLPVNKSCDVLRTFLLICGVPEEFHALFLVLKKPLSLRGESDGESTYHYRFRSTW